VSYGEYIMKKSSVFEWHRRFEEGEKMCKGTQKVGSQGQMQVWIEYEPWCSQIADKV
jgi:hypothetical protein